MSDATRQCSSTSILLCRPWLVLLRIVVLVIFFAPIVSCAFPAAGTLDCRSEAVRAADETSPSATAGTGETLIVATLNLAHGRGLAVEQLGLTPVQHRVNTLAAAEVVRKYQPDVLAVQEADASSAWSGWFNHVDLLAAEAGYEHVCHGIHFRAGIGALGGGYGTAILSNILLRNSESHRFDYGQVHTKGFVTAEIEFDGGDVVLVSVHLASGSAADRRREADIIVSVLEKTEKPIILMGDLNSEWHNEMDAVRIIASRLDLEAFEPNWPSPEATSNGTQSAASTKEFGLYTFRADDPRKRIDWILISPELEFIDYRIWPEQVSDHLGVSATVRWKSSP